MAAEKLSFKDVPSVHGLKVIENFKFPSGEVMLVTSTSPHSIHFSAADPSLKSFGNITVSGPNVVNMALDLGGIASLIEAFKGGVDKGLKAGCTTHTHMTFGPNGQMTSFETSTSCSTG